MASEPPPAKKPRLLSPSEPQSVITLDASASGTDKADFPDQVKSFEASSKLSTKQDAPLKKSVKKRKNRKLAMPEPYSHDDVLWHDIMAVLGKDVVSKAIEDGVEFDSPHKFHDEVELTVAALTSHGTSIFNPYSTLLSMISEDTWLTPCHSFPSS
jgi:hypothetical protein